MSTAGFLCGSGAVMCLRLFKYDIEHTPPLRGTPFMLFTSDNGPHREGGRGPAFFESRSPLRGIKRDLYEGALVFAGWGVISAVRNNSVS